MLQLVDFCRLCAQKKRNKMDLFADENEEAKMLIGKIFYCLSIHISKEDVLPKTICHDCQRAIEQFNAFRIKCQKAEERLNKMLSFNLPNKVLVTRIKEEFIETDFHENSQSYQCPDSHKRNDSISFVSVKPMKNVKSEIIEPETESTGETITETSIAENVTSDLIQIISEKMVNHSNLIDVKQPVIEIISENFEEEFKNNDATIDESDIFQGRAMEIVKEQEEHSKSEMQGNLDPGAVIEVKMHVTDSECEQRCPIPPPDDKKVKKRLKKSRKTTGSCGSEGNSHLRCKTRNRKRRRDLVESDVEIDSKYLILGEDEVCDIDMEEMEAVIKKAKDPNARFNCEKCGKSFKFFKGLKKHRNSHEGEPDAFICDACCNSNAKFFEFSSLKCLKLHIKRKHLMNNEAKFQCNLCARALTSKGQLNAHCKKVHDTSGASCQVCGKSFKNKTRLSDHLKVHSEDRPYVCDQCGHSFKWNNGLKVHMQSHAQEKNFLCSDCGKKFSAKKNLLEHLNIHTGKRPYKCGFCTATFVQLSAYSKHVYVHNEELKTHKCDKCEKSFSHAYLLKQHKIQHSGLRPYVCSVCWNSFKSQSDLCTHAKVHQEKRYPCSVCGRKFSRSKTLKDHMVRHTGVKHVCPAPGCGKSYTQRFPLTKHFCKNHPTLIIVNRMGGKKAHLGDKIVNNRENNADLDFIRYDYRLKDELNFKF